MKEKSGISLITLAITIVVIMILASIVVFEGAGVNDSARFARFTSEISDLNDAVKKEYASRLENGQGIYSDEQIYYMIANDLDEPPANISSVAISDIFGDDIVELKGTYAYEIPDDRNIDGWESNRRWFNRDEVHYITDAGEVFIVPGYLKIENDEEKLYVNAKKYVQKLNPLVVVGGEVKVGDYVTYIPDEATYENNEVPTGKDAKDYHLGHTTSGTLMTDTEAKWRVVKVDEATQKVYIVPEDAVNQLTLSNGPGYQNRVRILDYICGKLYSNNDLGTKARCLRGEDIDCIKRDITQHYAYYSNEVDETPNVTLDGKTYIGRRHALPNDSQYSYHFLTFWEYDQETSGDCINEMTINGYTYKYAIPTENKPVLLTYKDFYTEGPRYNEALGILGAKWSWIIGLGDLDYNVQNTFVKFGSILVNNTGLQYDDMVRSYGSNVGSMTLHLRPVVALGSGLQLDTTGTGDAGSSTNPWIITRAH